MSSAQETGPSIQDRLSAMGINPAALLLPEEVVGHQAEAEAQRKQEEIDSYVDSWRRSVESVLADTAALRATLEEKLRNDVESGNVKGLEDAETRVAEIDAKVAKGPERSLLHEGFCGDERESGGGWAIRYYQTYYVTVDEQGNIWGEFEAVKHEKYSKEVTRSPQVPLGKHVLRRNPTIPEDENKSSGQRTLNRYIPGL